MIIRFYDELDSTNYKIREKINSADHLSDNTNFVVIAGKQTSGYGTHNRKWESVNGNLHMSFDVQYEKQEYLSYLVSYALFSTIKGYINNHATVSIKWPNDIMINKKKVAGIIIEEFENRYIVGIGVNLVKSPLKISTDMSQFCNETLPSINQFIATFFINFNAEIIEMDNKGFLHFKRKWKIVKF